MSCGVGHRCSSDLMLLLLGHRPAGVAPIRPLAWKTPYVAGTLIKIKKNAEMINTRNSRRTNMKMLKKDFKIMKCGEGK